MQPQDLSGILKFEGVLEALLIRSGGTIVGQARSPAADAGNPAPGLSLLINESGLVASLLGRRSFSQAFLEYGDRIILIHKIGNDLFLALICRTDAKIGQILYQLKRANQGAGR